jgi:7-cyano-7-deazaguanine reductase
MTALGQQVPHIYVGADPKLLERVPNPITNDYRITTTVVTISGDEFTTLCPITGGPDYGSVEIVYKPDEWLVESKALKLYLGSFRMEPMFHEKAIAKICSDLANLLEPDWLEIEGIFKPRGGLAIKPYIRFEREKP